MGSRFISMLLIVSFLATGVLFQNCAKAPDLADSSQNGPMDNNKVVEHSIQLSQYDSLQIGPNLGAVGDVHPIAYWDDPSASTNIDLRSFAINYFGSNLSCQLDLERQNRLTQLLDSATICEEYHEIVCLMYVTPIVTLVSKTNIQTMYPRTCAGGAYFCNQDVETEVIKLMTEINSSSASLCH